MTFSCLVVIPVYNHPDTIEAMVNGVRAAGLPCLLVDDGSDERCAAVLDALERRHAPDVQLIRLATNRGKGEAVSTGLRAAHLQGFTHALQIDADGQHDAADIPKFVLAADSNANAMICGAPIYDESIPKGRLYGRYLTHVWVWINTLSLEIKDSMCGFRVYPLESVMSVLDKASIGRRMDFDSEVLVRLHWDGVRMITVPTRVTYPRDGVSHFKVWRDNCLISVMHARLFAGMLMRLPVLLGRKVRATRNSP